MKLIAVASLITLLFNASDSECSSASTPGVPFLGRPDHSLVRKILDDLDSRLDGTVLHRDRADDAVSFEKASHVWRAGVNPPAAVVQVASEEDVALAVPVLARLDAEHGVPFRIKSGGHHYDGLSSGEGGICLSLSRLNTVEIDDETSSGDHICSARSPTATFGPGARVIDVLERIIPHSYGAAVGACPTVGEGGFVLGGGFSYASRNHGLGVDNVVKMRAVLASGKVVTASAIENSDLFWALRGAGSAGLAVVTEITYKLFPSQDTQLYVSGAVPIDHAPTFIQSIGAKDLPGNVGFALFLFPQQFFKGYLASFHWIDENDRGLVEGQKVIGETLNDILPKNDAESFTFKNESWTEHTRAADMPRKLFRVWNGFLSKENNTVEIWSEILSVLQTIREEADEYICIEILLFGGAISAVLPHETAFPWRGGLFNIAVNLGVPADLENAQEVFEEKSAMVEREWQKVSQHLEGVYYNYPVKTLRKSQYGRAYWGTNLDRLKTIKKKYDSDNVFYHPQSVPTS